jgi:hypothetical protein
MAKSSKSSGNSIKQNFGRRRTGKAKKTENKHASPSSKYRGQGK